MGLQKGIFICPFPMVVLAQRALIFGAYNIETFMLCSWTADDCLLCLSGQLRSSICKQVPLLSTSKQGKIFSGPLSRRLVLRNLTQQTPSVRGLERYWRTSSYYIALARWHQQPWLLSGSQSSTLQ